jgi:hypothetical protein
VLKTRLNQGEDKDRVICEGLQRCFDVLVEDHIEQGGNLDFALLHQAIPDKVLESAVALEWLEPAWGPQNIAWGYREWLMRLLEGRIEYFEACEIGRPFGHEHQKPDFVVTPLPEPDDPVMQLLPGPVPQGETQRTGQVVYAGETRESGRAVPTIEVPATALAERLKEALSQTEQAAAGIAKPLGAVPHPRRAVWLEAELAFREWTVHDLQAQGGPDWKTTRKILDGLQVSRVVLKKTAAALSKKGKQVLAKDIPKK